MRIGVEADRMWANRFGIGRFIRGTLSALQAGFPEHQYVLFSLTQATQPSRRIFSPVRMLRGVRRLAWMHTGLPREAARQKVDVLFCPDYLVPWRSPCPVVAVVHDLLFAEHPEWGERLVLWQLRLSVSSALHRIARVVTPSESSRSRLIDIFRCQPQQVVVVPEGVEAHFHPMNPGEVAVRLSQYGVADCPFVLFVGAWSPPKNLVRLVQVFSSLRPRYRGKLVLVGGGGWSRRPLLQVIRDCGMEDDVKLLGFVADEDLPAFYNGADLFAFPSLYEGFGLPVLEAMACGCPVVASNVTSIPEVADGAARLVDPYDVDRLTEAMREVLEDRTEQARLRQRGFERAKQFTWARTARMLERVFQDVA